MKSIMNDFKLSHKVSNGMTNELINCHNCHEQLIISNIFRFTYSKIKIIKCSNCQELINIGDIYNFKTGRKLNKPNTHHNPNTLDNKIWGGKYF